MKFNISTYEGPQHYEIDGITVLFAIHLTMNIILFTLQLRKMFARKNPTIKARICKK